MKIGDKTHALIVNDKKGHVDEDQLAGAWSRGHARWC